MKALLFLLLFTFTHNSLAQISTTRKIKVSGNVYNKQTGQKLTEEETIDLLEKYPEIIFEHVYNKYGVVEKLLFDPNNIVTGKITFRNEENQIKPGELFPEYVFKTIDGEKITNKKLYGSWVLLRFELFAKMINQQKITSLEKQIIEFNLSNKLTAIIIFADTKNNIKQYLGSKGSIFKLVPDGINFQEMYSIIQFPTSILIDKNGVVYKYYTGNEKIDFSNLKKNESP